MTLTVLIKNLQVDLKHAVLFVLYTACLRRQGKRHLNVYKLFVGELLGTFGAPYLHTLALELSFKN